MKLEYLKKYISNEDDIKRIIKSLDEKYIEAFEVMSFNVIQILDYLKSIEIDEFVNLILARPDVCFMETQILEEKLNKFDRSLIKFVIENDPQNLINFDI